MDPRRPRPYASAHSAGPPPCSEAGRDLRAWAHRAGRDRRVWRPKAATDAVEAAPGARGPQERVGEWLTPGGEAERSLARYGFAVLRGALLEAERSGLLELVETGVERIADWKWYKARQGPGEELRPRTVNMARTGFGSGLYTYLRDPLPAPLDELRGALYTALAPIANGDIVRHSREVAPKPFAVPHFPAEVEAFHELCRGASPPQVSPTCLALQYDVGGHNSPHRDIYGCISFPYQALCVLTVPGRDFEGGEFYTQPRKGADDRRQHIPLAAGDLLVFRSSSWHGSEPVTWGRRVAVGIQFHLAPA
mmetsp:Transcript_15190/g.48576  ORF Transcript_15190/g.48576 Transcript_15190/m.48576 type:complete len:308 (+) Transcript_15190:43-966(+)